MDMDPEERMLYATAQPREALQNRGVVKRKAPGGRDKILAQHAGQQANHRWLRGSARGAGQASQRPCD